MALNHIQITNAKPRDKVFKLTDAIGDAVELFLPLPMQLEPIDPRHPDAAALVRRPLVLMALKRDIDAPAPALSRSSILGARRAGATDW